MPRVRVIAIARGHSSRDRLDLALGTVGGRLRSPGMRSAPGNNCARLMIPGCGLRPYPGYPEVRYLHSSRLRRVLGRGRLDFLLGPVSGQFAGEGFLEKGLFEFHQSIHFPLMNQF